MPLFILPDNRRKDHLEDMRKLHGIPFISILDFREWDDKQQSFAYLAAIILEMEQSSIQPTAKAYPISKVKTYV